MNFASTGRAFALFLGVAVSSVLAGCTQSSQSVTLRSLESSGEMSFLCMSSDYAARNLDDCPDEDPVDGEDRYLFSMVTQTTRGEVALVDLTNGSVVDDEPTVPGFNFLPVGAAPRSIVSTPGGVASFVSVAEIGKEGIFALPTSCVRPRSGNDKIRDLTVWPACRLPSAPGSMAVLVDHSAAAGEGGKCPNSVPTATSEEIESRECPADLSLETQSPGRRLLAVTLPDVGQIAVIDAQALLDRQPGSFDPCPIESIMRLRVDLPKDPVVQKLPPDLDIPGAPRPVGFVRPTTDTYESRPAGLALVDDPKTGEELIYVSDQQAPVIHVLDVKDPCSIREKPPLLPMSFKDPTRVVTTAKVAASPLTSKAERFLYAIDESKGRVMIFDVSQGSTDRTPLLRPRSALLYNVEPEPDRISFSAPANDITFAIRDKVEVDPATGSQRVGVFCNPDPAIDPNSPEALYRAATDFSSGAGPGVLRGVFGFAALSNGSIAVIDVEDFDEPCRRPIYTNKDETPDFRGCANDPAGIEFYTLTPDNPLARSTVTNEASCNVVEPHRARSTSYLLNDQDTGVRAPALRAFPTLVSDVGRTLPNDASDEGRKNPKMLGVNFGKTLQGTLVPAQVYVGSTLYDTGNQDSKLDIDPTVAEQNSVVLNVTDPRSYPIAETFSAAFEGSLYGERTSSKFAYDEKTGVATLSDSASLSVCDLLGVEDVAIARQRGQGLGVAAADLDVFAHTHADYVRITSDLLDEDDVYWSNARGAKCGGASADAPGAGFLQCRTLLGTRAAMGEQREFTIEEARSNAYTLSPRRGTAETSAGIDELVSCCFPQGVSYEVRAANAWIVRGTVSGYRHDLTTDPATGRCQLDKTALRSRQHGRVYEVSCDPASPDCSADGTTAKSVGLAHTAADDPARDVACIISNPVTDAQTVGASPCIFNGLSSTFVIYRGQNPSLRDWSFQWDVIGGFSPLLVNLAVASDPNSNPQTMQFSKQLGQLVIADGSSKGLVLLDLSNFATQYFF